MTIIGIPDMDIAGTKMVAKQLRHQINMFVMFGARVPVNRIIGSFMTGYGCVTEQEFVVLGPQVGRDKVFVTSGDYGDVAAQRMAALLLATNGEYIDSEKDVDKGDG